MTRGDIPTEELFPDEAKATISSSAINLTKTIIGCGILTVPYNLMSCGWALGGIVLLFMGVTSTYSFHLLTQASNYCRTFMYREVAEQLYGRCFAIFVAVVVAFYTFGSICSYTIVMQDNFFWWSDTEGHSEYHMYKKLLMWGLLLGLITPLCFLPRIDFLKYTSIIALSSVCYVVCVVIAFFAIVMDDPYASSEKGSPVAFSWSVDALTTIPLFATAFCGHYNCMNIYRELKGRNIRRMDAVILITGVASTAFNAIMGFFGYFAFTDSCESDILKNIAGLEGSGKIFFYIANCAFILVMCCSFPLLVFAVRRTIESIFWKEGDKFSKWWSYLINAILIVGAGLIGTFVPTIDAVLSFSASLCGVPIIYIFPGFFVYTIAKRENGSARTKILSMFMAVLGIALMLLGFGSAVWKIIIQPLL